MRGTQRRTDRRSARSPRAHGRLLRPRGRARYEIGREAETITVSAGGFVAVPPGVAHSFRNESGKAARWLTIHARDGGFAAFMRGMRDGVEVEWDISPVPADGGLPASEAIVSPGVGGERPESEQGSWWLRCALPDLCAVEWRLRGSDPDLPALRRACGAGSYFVTDGELDVTLAGSRQNVGPGTLISIPRGVESPALDCAGPEPVRMLSLHTLDGFAQHLRMGAAGFEPATSRV